jgi:hypothetical protein
MLLLNQNAKQVTLIISWWQAVREWFDFSYLATIHWKLYHFIYSVLQEEFSCCYDKLSSFKSVQVSLSKTSSVTHPSLMVYCKKFDGTWKEIETGNLEKPTELNFVLHLNASSRGHSKWGSKVEAIQSNGYSFHEPLLTNLY